MTNGYFPGALTAARHTKGHNASGCTLPSDSLTAEEIRKLNGEVKTIRLRPGITWAELCALSDSMQIAYLTTMLEHGARAKTLGKMLGVSDSSVRMRLKALGIPSPDKVGVSQTVIDGKDKQWEAWCLECYEADKKEEPVMEEKPAVKTVSTAVSTPAVIMRQGTVDMRGTASGILQTIAKLLPEGELQIALEWRRADDSQ